MRNLTILYKFRVDVEGISGMEQLDICHVLRAISDDKALAIFNTIALSADSAAIAISRLKLTRKQYYSRMSIMVDANLITRRNGRYFLTSFGKIVYEAQMLIGRAQQNYWKLKAVDTIESSSNNTLSLEERDRLISSLIVDNELKEILLGVNKRKENNQELIALQT
jgi:hypothetical protein